MMYICTYVDTPLYKHNLVKLDIKLQSFTAYHIYIRSYILMSM